MNKRLILGVLLWGAYLQGQELEGRLRDSLGQPVAQARVWLHPAEGMPARGAAFSDSLGRFRIPGLRSEHLRIGVAAMGFRALDTLVTREAGKPWPLLQFTLQASPFLLQEVVVRAEKAMRVGRDTVEFLVDPYTRGTEQVAEDILRRLPGVEVSPDGEIRVRGKPIGRVLVEGDDLTARRYRILTRNLDAGAIEKVQVLQDYQENRALRGLKSSREVALNLVLRDGVKGRWAGRGTPGLGSGSRYDVRINLMYLKRAVKLYALGHTNTVGEDPAGDLFELLHPEVLEPEFPPGEGQASGSGFTPRLDLLPLERRAYVQNRAGMGSVNTVWRPGSGFRVQAQVLGLRETERVKWSRQETLQGADSLFRIAEVRLQQLREQFVSGAWEVAWEPDTTHRLLWKTRWSLGRFRQADSLVFNGQGNIQDRQLSVGRWESSLDYTHRWGAATALRLAGRWIAEKRPETLDFDGYLLSGFWGPGQPGWETRQRFLARLQYTGLRAALIHKQGAHTLEAQAYWSISQSAMENQWGLGIPGGAPEGPFGKAAEQRRRMGLRLEWTLDKPAFRTALSLEGLGAWANYSENGTRRFRALALVPGASIRWQPAPRHTLQARYTFDFRESHFAEQWSTPLLSGYRSIRTGLGRYFPFRSHRLTAGYTFGDWGDPTRLFAFALWRLEPGFPGMDWLQRPGFIAYSLRPMSQREMITLNLNLDHYLEALQCNLKWKAAYTRQDYTAGLEGTLNPVQHQNLSLGPELRSAFGKGLEFHGGLTISRLWSGFGGRNRTSALRGFLDLEAGRGPGWSARIRNEYFDYPDAASHPLWLSSATVQHTPEKGRVHYRLQVQNLWNASFFGLRTLQDTGYQDSGYALSGRWVLLQVSVRL
ncbi:carboxypeptidase regulatory-like domain-containing protein [Robiginitalea sp. M366]|uniref:TonB-dependent receptor n=1 Tax=Robiginitalea aestuariiviva TaxID=3036903 RepID=UPI00240D13DC|nr:carboxypeptidase regulatory-like domain-containing protein [Robiginitalea aestuariiviva]MDG1572181.1 carboxypeptidase regulatory-like domain-containing protein [Robiginitalea aestuariiviva]